MEKSIFSLFIENSTKKTTKPMFYGSVIKTTNPIYGIEH
jgi:hypothetical protein